MMYWKHRKIPRRGAEFAEITALVLLADSLSHRWVMVSKASIAFLRLTASRRRLRANCTSAAFAETSLAKSSNDQRLTVNTLVQWERSRLRLAVKRRRWTIADC